MFTHSSVTGTFLDFFADRGHVLLPSASLVPASGDVLFTTSGMHPLTPFLEGAPHPAGVRLASLQRCLRTTDLDEVGDATHLTVFQMLGSWSLGDYDGPRSLAWGLELLEDGFGLRRDRLFATAFAGDDLVGEDTRSLRLWEGLGVRTELLGEENWWSNGPVGPCGPDSELFVWTGSGEPSGSPSTDDRWVEVWNHVSMRYLRLEGGSVVPLQRPNVDTGLGLERLLALLQEVPSVHDTDVFLPWRELTPLWGLPPGVERRVVDHLRSALVVAGDGVTPAASGRGYVLRRLLRRALTDLWSVDPSVSLNDLPGGLLEHTGDVFGLDLSGALPVLVAEEVRFASLLSRARPLVARALGRGPLTDAVLADLHATHGLPPELVRSLA